jgi:hypothetical protein
MVVSTLTKLIAAMALSEEDANDLCENASEISDGSFEL